MNLLTERPPDYTVVDGVKYPVYTDFRNWIQIEIILSRGNLSGKEAAQALTLCYRSALPPTPVDAMQGLFSFYACGKEPENDKDKTDKTDKASKKPIYSFEYDAEHIYSAFLTQYKIDLGTADMHWWTFRALFAGLTEENTIVKIMQWRSMDLTKIKDKKERARYRSLKNKFALPDMRTPEQCEQDMNAVLGKWI